MKKIFHKLLVVLASALLTIPIVALAQDYFQATGIPVQRSAMSSAEFRTEFSSIESLISDKLPAYTGNGNNFVKINVGGTALTSVNNVTARTDLGLAIGTNVQAWDEELDEIAALANTDSNFIVGNGTAWVAEGASTARTSLGLGSLATSSTISNTDWSGTDLAVANGGTGSSTAADARTALGLAIGSNVQAYDADLAAIAALVNSDSNFIVGNGSAWVAETGATVRTSLGLGSLATVNSVNDSDWSGTDLAVANGGTGSSTAGNARTALGLAIGSDVQAFDTELSEIAALLNTNNNFLVGTGTVWALESPSSARTSLGLGSLAIASTVNNGEWSGTDLAVTNGGTGSSTASDARTALGLVIGTNVQAFASVLANTTASFLSADETKLDGMEALADVTDATNVASAGAPIISSGSGSPISTPSAVGDIYIDTTADTSWLATGTASSADWKQASGVGGGDLLAANNLNDVASASTSRTNLGLAIGTNVQAFDTELLEIAGLANTNNNFMVGTGTVWALETPSAARTSLGLGSLATASDINGGDWNGTDLAVADGGTGSSTAANARTALGVVIGTNVQAQDADLDAIAALLKTDSNFIVGNGSTWVLEDASTARTSLGLGSLATASTVDNGDWATVDLALVNGGTGSSTASGARTNLGLAIGTDVQAFDTDLTTIAGLIKTNNNFMVANGSAWTSESASSARTSLGLGDLATQGTINNTDWSGTDLAIINGGTGAGTAGTARSNLGLVIGTDVQAHDTELSEIAALANTNNNFIVGTGTVWALESASSARSSLGLGSLATASNVNDGDWSGTDLTVANGGTGSSTASGAASNLGLGTGDTPNFTGVHIDSTDSTITRKSAGEIEIEGRPLIAHDNTNYVSGKIFITNVTPSDTSGMATGDFKFVY